MSENIKTPAELFGEDPTEYAIRSAAAEDILQQLKTEEKPDYVSQLGGSKEKRARLREVIGAISVQVQDSIEEQP